MSERCSLCETGHHVGICPHGQATLENPTMDRMIMELAINTARQEGYTQGCQDTWDAAIRAECVRCGKTEDGGVNHPRKIDNTWYHFYLTDYFKCEASKLHEVRKKGEKNDG